MCAHFASSCDGQTLPLPQKRPRVQDAGLALKGTGSPRPPFEGPLLLYRPQPPLQGQGTRIACLNGWLGLAAPLTVGAFWVRTERTRGLGSLTRSSIQYPSVPQPGEGIDPQVDPPHDLVLKSKGSNPGSRSYQGIGRPGTNQPYPPTRPPVLHPPMEHRSRQKILALGHLGRIRPGETILPARPP